MLTEYDTKPEYSVINCTMGICVLAGKTLGDAIDWAKEISVKHGFVAVVINSTNHKLCAIVVNGQVTYPNVIAY